MKYRSRTEIIARILPCAAEGTKKTHIMSRSSMPYHQAKLYFELIEAHGLLEYEPLDSIFRTTEKGLAFLRVYGYINT
jgi:predicted transcriptional regulator